MTHAGVRRLFPSLSLIIGLVAICLVVHLAGDLLVENALTEALVYMVMVVGLWVFVGNSGIISFGHVSNAVASACACAFVSATTAAR